MRAAAIAILAGAAACAAAVSYPEMTDERQQAYLEGVARGIEAGFRASAGDAATIKTVSVDAGRDLVALEIKFTPPQVESAPYEAVMKLRKQVFEQMCNIGVSKKLLEDGVSLRLELKKPSGMSMTTIALSGGACAPYRNAEKKS